MEKSYLIQRLLSPWKTEARKNAMANAFSFGGGLKNGGLSDEAMDLIKDIFRFDYMGAAEFEWGEVPKALAKIVDGASKHEYMAFRIPVPYRYKDWDEEKEQTGIKPVWIICRKMDDLEVIDRINRLATNTYLSTKESVNLDSAMAEHKYSLDIIGWLELDNAYMFFVDEEAFRKTIQLFGITEE